MEDARVKELTDLRNKLSKKGKEATDREKEEAARKARLVLEEEKRRLEDENAEIAKKLEEVTRDAAK